MAHIGDQVTCEENIKMLSRINFHCDNSLGEDPYSHIKSNMQQEISRLKRLYEIRLSDIKKEMSNNV